MWLYLFVSGWMSTDILFSAVSMKRFTEGKEPVPPEQYYTDTGQPVNALPITAEGQSEEVTAPSF